jgi:hypothetical protein
LVLQRGLRFDRTHARSDQFGQLCQSLRRRRTRRWHHHGSKQGQHAGIDPVGFVKESLRLGEH